MTTICIQPGCPHPATRRARCPTHQLPRLEGRPWRRLVSQILARDHSICHICGRPGATTADHLTRIRDGGTNHPANLKAAHIQCNTRRA